MGATLRLNFMSVCPECQRRRGVEDLEGDRSGLHPIESAQRVSLLPFTFKMAFVMVRSIRPDHGGEGCNSRQDRRVEEIR